MESVIVSKTHLLVLCLLSLFVAVPSWAQPLQDPDKMISMLNEQLDLTDSQKVAIKQILIDTNEKITKLMMDKSTDRIETMTQAMTIMNTVNGKIFVLLNEKQKILFRKYMTRQKKPLID